MPPATPHARCPIRTALDLIGGKWKLLLLYQLADGPLRYGALRQRLPGASDKVLVQQLRVLEQDRLISRKDYHSAPPRVEYALTEAGRHALPLIEQLAAFTHRYVGTTRSERA